MTVATFTPAQLRAARGLLDWTRNDLSEAANVSPETIKNIEHGTFKPQQNTANTIIRAFSLRGVAFTENEGVQIKSDATISMEGDDCYLRLLNEIYRVMHDKKDEEVLSICTDDSASPPEVVEALGRWHTAGMRCRFITHENASRFDFPLDEYHLLPAKYFVNRVMVIWGDQVATIRRDGKSLVIIRDPDQASMLRRIFDFIWDKTESAKVIKK